MSRIPLRRGRLSDPYARQYRTTAAQRALRRHDRELNDRIAQYGEEKLADIDFPMYNDPMPALEPIPDEAMPALEPIARFDHFNFPAYNEPIPFERVPMVEPVFPPVERYPGDYAFDANVRALPDARALPGGRGDRFPGGDGAHPLLQVPSHVRNTIRAFSVLRAGKDLFDALKNGPPEKRDIELRDDRVAQAADDRMEDRISEQEAKKRIDDANLKQFGAGLKRLVFRTPGVAANLAFGYNPASFVSDVVQNAPTLTSVIKSGLRYAGSKMGIRPSGLPTQKAFFEHAKQRFTVARPYGVLGGHVPVSGHQPRFVKCKGGIC